MNQNLVAVTGNTYPVKEELKALGARWNNDRRAWMVPPSKVTAAQAVVAGAPAASRRSFSPARSAGGRRTGCSCGSREGYSQPSDCWTCKFDQDDN